MKAWTLVTGGAKGLGAEICRTLAKKGCNIVVHYNTSFAQAQEVVDECLREGVFADCIQGDFSTCQTTQDFIQNYLSRFPMTENLINNVGNYFLGSALETSLQNWCVLFQTNLHAPLALIQALTPSLKESKGNIINIGVAGIANVRTDTYSTAYSTTKTALWMLTRSLASQLSSFGVRVNMVSPGYLQNSVDFPKNPVDLPMGRLGTLEETARVVAFLLDPASSYITGQNLEVAGGVRLT